MQASRHSVSVIDMTYRVVYYNQVGEVRHVCIWRHNAGLKRWGRKKIDVIFKWIVVIINFAFENLDSFKYVFRFNSALVQVMTWRWTGDGQLPKPMMIKLYDGMCHHVTTMS